jgi:hypothetical protein
MIVVDILNFLYAQVEARAQYQTQTTITPRIKSVFQEIDGR